MVSLMARFLRFFKALALNWYWVLSIGFFGVFAWCYFVTPRLPGGTEMTDDELKIWFTCASLVLPFTYFFQKQKLAEDQIFLDSFEKFNKRFYELVDDLNKVLKKDENRKVTNQGESGALDQSAKNTQEQESKFSLSDPVIHKYFDLCLEEYQLYKANRIPEKIWKYWAKGMCYYLECPLIRKYWEEMDRNNLSDGLTVEALEKYAGE